MSYHYVDRHGEEIKPGYLISIAGDEPEIVYETVDGFGRPNLGVSASNEEYLKHHPDAERLYYSLSNFDCMDIEIQERCD